MYTIENGSSRYDMLDKAVVKIRADFENLLANKDLLGPGKRFRHMRYRLAHLYFAWLTGLEMM